MDTLAFSTNWNNKLGCPAFGTIRLDNEKKYAVGRRFSVTLNGREIGTARAVSVRRFAHAHITESLAYLDTGFGAAYLRTLLAKMYPNTNWERQWLMHVVLAWETAVPVVMPRVQKNTHDLFSTSQQAA